MPSHVGNDQPASFVRPWRIVFTLYAIALTVGTHWPRLELDVGELPAPDKILHLLGFGGLAFLLWRTRWLPDGNWPLALVAMLWALLDELTQAIALLGRTFSWLDVVGGWLGILLVLVWLWAIAPLGGTMSRSRRAVHENLLDELFLRPGTWLIVSGSGLAGAAVLGVPMAMYVAGIEPRATLSGFAAAGILGAATGSLIALRVLWRASQREAGLKPIARGVWRAAIWHAIVTFIGALGVLAAGYAAAWNAQLHASWALILLEMPHEFVVAGVPEDLRLAIDLTAIGLLLAVSVRICRETLARGVDTVSSDDRPL